MLVGEIILLSTSLDFGVLTDQVGNISFKSNNVQELNSAQSQ